MTQLAENDLYPQVDQLGLAQRARLAEHLLRTLDEPGQEELERLWLEEARRRMAACRAGQVTSIPAEEVFRRALADLA